MESYANQIRKISSMLTEENWHKGSYFAIRNNKLCMCVHGAGQILVNPQVKLAFDSFVSSMTGNPIVQDDGIAEKYFEARLAAIASGAVVSADEALPVEEVYQAIETSVSYAISSATTADDAEKNVFQKKTDSLYLIWKNRHPMIKNNHFILNKDHGNTNLHFLMGMFGISSILNDYKDTTLEMLKVKLEECAVWAEQNQEFLQNN